MVDVPERLFGSWRMCSVRRCALMCEMALLTLSHELFVVATCMRDHLPAPVRARSLTPSLHVAI
jgi:hypothetical protein